SSLCGACFDACPVRIDIPALLVHLRGKVVAEKGRGSAEAIAIRVAAWVMSKAGRFGTAERISRVGRPLGRRGRIRTLPPPLTAWTAARDAPVPPRETFREWWRRTRRTS